MMVAYLGRDDRDFIVELTVLINCNTPLAVAQGMTMELDHSVSGATRGSVDKRTFDVSGLPVSSPSFWPSIF